MPSTANPKYEISPPTELKPHCDQQYAVTACQNYFVVRFKLQNKSGVGRGSSVGVATCYMLDGSRFDTRWMRDFLQQSTTALGAHPTSRTVGVSTWIVPKLSRVSQVYRSERGVNQPPLSNGNVKEWVELCLYSLSGSSCPVLGGGFIFFLQWRQLGLCPHRNSYLQKNYRIFSILIRTILQFQRAKKSDAD